jgi:hypothetical protein
MFLRMLVHLTNHAAPYTKRQKGSDLPRIFFREDGGVSTNSIEDRGQREREFGGLAPYSGVPLNLQMSETRILIRVLWMYFSRNREFASALSKLWNFGVGGEGVEPSHTSPRYAAATRQQHEFTVLDKLQCCRPLGLLVC